MTTIRGLMQGNDRRASGTPGAHAARRSRALRAIGATAALSLLPILGAIAPAQTASATDWPSWQDVQQATADANANAALVKQIDAQVAALKAQVAQTQADAEAKGEIYGDAQNAYDSAELKFQGLNAQADDAKAKAAKAKTTADRLIGGLTKPGGGSFTASLIANPGGAKNLLYKWGTMAKLSQQSKGIYDAATQAQGTAQALTDQADKAKAERDRRKVIAEQAFQVAQAAAQAAADAQAQAEVHLAEAAAQQVVLNEKRAATAADYQKGLAERYGSGAAGEVNLKTGWGRPAAGPITSSFGLRLHPIYKTYKLHTGTDIGAGCGAPIFAGHAGTVIYAGWFSDLGNFIQIDHGNGITTGYGHIVNGGIMVHMGQSVAPGQQIAKVGSTGGSTGCHLHYMVRINGNLTDPVPFMRGQGMPIG